MSNKGNFLAQVRNALEKKQPVHRTPANTKRGRQLASHNSLPKETVNNFETCEECPDKNYCITQQKCTEDLL